VLPLVVLQALAVATPPQPQPEIAAEPRPDYAPHGVEGRFGMAFFGGEMGGAGLSGLGIHLAFNRRLGDDVGIAVEGAYLGLHDSDGQVDWRGRMSRAALVTRWELVETNFLPVMGAWLDVGVGVEHVSWHDGGVLVRPELLVGLGGTMGGLWGGPKDRGGRFGDFFDVRALVTRGPGCAGRMCPVELEWGIQGAVGFYFSE